MTVLELRFPAGRFHATPWGRHVNEGVVEWPPSPWRILRALIATWYWKARRDGEISEETMRAMVNVLSQSPVFRLPHATTAHTRHYLPYNEGKNEKTTKVFDTFIQIAEGESVLVAWNIDLTPEQLTTLKTLAARLGYFGRAESLVEARVLEGVTAIESNASPVEGKNMPAKSELVRLLAPMKPAAYDEWRTKFLNANHSPGETKKKSGTNSKTPDAPKVPDNLFAALHADTGELQAAAWNLPPGAEYVNYVRPENAFVSAAKPRPRSGKELPTVARFAVVSTVAPSITQAISVANRAHEALCKWSDHGEGRAAVFTGLDDDGKPRGDHAHAHILCEANGPRDAITHITIWATMGFDPQACLALRRLKKVWGHGGHDIRFVLHGIGHPADFAECALFNSSKIWRSLTPFVSTRHAKTFRDGRPKMDEATGWQIGSPGHDLLRLLSLHPETAGAKIRQDKVISIGQTPNTRALRCLQFQTTRYDGGGSRGHCEGGSFSVSFPKRVAGPLAFGYGAHFGLGLFVPVQE